MQRSPAPAGVFRIGLLAPVLTALALYHHDHAVADRRRSPAQVEDRFGGEVRPLRHEVAGEVLCEYDLDVAPEAAGKLEVGGACADDQGDYQHDQGDRLPAIDGGRPARGVAEP